MDAEHDDAPHQELFLLRDGITVSQTHILLINKTTIKNGFRETLPDTPLLKDHRR